MLKQGDRAPAFSLPADTGETISLRDFKGKPVILYFYPRDDTSGCTVEACEFRDSWKDVTKAGAVVLGVSPDSPRSHQKFRTKYDLPFPLLADEGHEIAEAYGAWGDKSMYGRKYRGILRTTFLIGKNGKISRVFAKVKPNGHAAEVLAALNKE